MDFKAKLGLAEPGDDTFLKYIVANIALASQGAKLTWANFTFMVNGGVVITELTTVSKCVEGGMPYLDALYFIHGKDKPTDIKITQREATNAVKVDYQRILNALFAWYFSLYTQGRAVAIGANNFLVQLMGYTDQFPALIRSLTSATIELFPTQWIREVKTLELSDKCRNRLALGAAGHRYIGALAYIRQKDYKAGAELNKEFIDKLRAWTSDRIWWELHPLFKDSAVITVTKSLNKSIEDCIATGLTDEAITRLVNAKVLHQTPKQQPAHTQWVNLKAESLPVLRLPVGA
jgi:hypothetical protein